MKTHRLIFLGIAATLLLWCAVPASADVNIGFFHEELDPYGDWVQVRHGWGWVPGDVPPGWRPYSAGRWVYTEDGPLWVADEPWGEIPFHYGRWFFDPYYGWVWIPGSEWAPAWVVWRNGGGYLGWAPLTPEVGWNPRAGLVWGGITIEAFDPFSWVFVQEREVFAPSIMRVAIQPPRNITIIRQTRNITQITVERDRFVDRSFTPATLSRWTGRPVTPLRVAEQKEFRRGRAVEVRDKEKDVRVYRPKVTGDIKAVQPKRERPPQGLVQPRSVQKDRQLLQDRVKSDRQQLEIKHKQDLKNPPPSVKPEVLRKQQQEELDLLEQYYQRENNRLENRSKPGKGPAQGQGNKRSN